MQARALPTCLTAREMSMVQACSKQGMEQACVCMCVCVCVSHLSVCERPQCFHHKPQLVMLRLAREQRLACQQLNKDTTYTHTHTHTHMGTCQFNPSDETVHTAM